jgi:hypothetical protein
MQTKREIHELVDRLPESETGAAARFLEFLLADDEILVYSWVLLAPGTDETFTVRGAASQDRSPRISYGLGGTARSR